MPENKPRSSRKATKLAENKTKPTTASVVDFLNTITPAQKRDDSFVLLRMMRAASNSEPVLWSNSYIGFGVKRHKSSATGRESEWMRIGFAPRKTNFSIYFGDLIGKHSVALEKLGKFKTGMGCLYVSKLSDIDLKVLEAMIASGWKQE